MTQVFFHNDESNFNENSHDVTIESSVNCQRILFRWSSVIDARNIIFFSLFEIIRLQKRGTEKIVIFRTITCRNVKKFVTDYYEAIAKKMPFQKQFARVARIRRCQVQFLNSRHYM